MTIFVVEDDELYQKVIKYTLDQGGYNNVRYYSSAEECIDNLNLKPGIILLDIGLARINGVDLLKKIKNAKKSIKVIMFTGSDDEDVIKRCLEIGADGYVIKGENAMTEVLDLLKAYNKKGKVPAIITFSVMALVLAIYLVLQFFL